MKLPTEAIEELKEIYMKEYGKELSESEAQEMALRLLSLFSLLIKTPPKHILT